MVNLGKLITGGGDLGVFAASIRNHGVIEADRIGRDGDGNVVLSASRDITLGAGLAERAEQVGSYLRSALADRRLDGVGRIRGAGLMVGVEWVDAGGGPDPDRAGAVVERMKQNGVLVGRTGRDRNVLKIRPPLVFGMEHADLVLETLVGSL